MTADIPIFIHHREHFARRLVAEGYRVHLLGGGPEVDLSPLLDAGITVERFDIERMRFDPAADVRLFLKLRQVVNSTDPAIVHATTLKAIVMAKIVVWLTALIRRHPPCLILSFAGLGRAFAPARGVRHAIRKWLLLTILNLKARRLRWLATVEHAADGTRLREMGFDERVPIVLVHGAGIDLDVYAAKPKSGLLKVLYAGRLLRSKGAGVYLEAVRRLAPAHPDVSFLLAGPAELSDPDSLPEASIAAMSGIANFRYLGALPPEKMPGLLASVDVVCLPSVYGEGVPRILMEAAACGCSYVSTMQPGWLDIVGKAEATGWFIDDFSPAAVAEALAAAIADPAETRRRGKRARSVIERSNVSEEDMQERFLSAYRTLLAADGQDDRSAGASGAE